MKPLILVSLLFTFVWVNAQKKIMPATYTSRIENNSCWGDFSTAYDYSLFILYDTTVKLSITVKYHDILHSSSFTTEFCGNGKINGDTLNVCYTLLPSIQSLHKSKIKSYYVPAFSERVFYPPMVFVLTKEKLEDLNHDFPILNKIHPAMAMSWQGTSVKFAF